MTQAEFNAMLQTAVAQGLPGGYISSRWRWEDVETSLGKLDVTGAVAKRVSLTAAEVVPYIRAMPRLLTENYSFSVSGGTIDQQLTFSGFYGPGRIWFQADDLVLNKGLSVSACSTYIRVIGVKVRGAVLGENSMILLRYAPAVSLENLDVDAAGCGDVRCVYADFSTVYLSSASLKNGSIAVQASLGSVISAKSVSGSGNAIGGRVYVGGVLLLSGTTPVLLGGSSNSKLGGIIAKADGTLI